MFNNTSRFPTNNLQNDISRNVNGSNPPNAERSNPPTDAVLGKRARESSSIHVGAGTGSAHVPIGLHNQWNARQAGASSPTAAERVSTNNNALGDLYKTALNSARTKKLIKPPMCSNLGSAATVFLEWASEEKYDITAKNHVELQELIIKYVDSLDKSPATKKHMKSKINAFLHWRTEGKVRLPKGVVSGINNQLDTDYKSALALAAKTRANNNQMIIGENAPARLGSTAAAFLTWAGERKHDIAAKNHVELQELIIKYLDDKRPVARVSMQSDLGAFLYWRKNNGEVRPQKGVVIAITKEHEQVIASNNQLATAYKDALKTAAERKLIRKEAPRDWGGAAAGFLEWASDSKKQYDIAAKNHVELQELITEYIDKEYPLDNTGKPSDARYKMKSNLDAFLYWRKNETVKPRQGAESSTADDADGVWDPEAESLFAFFTDTGSGAADDADGEWDPEAWESLNALLTNTGFGDADGGAQGMLGDAESHVGRTNPPSSGSSTQTAGNALGAREPSLRAGTGTGSAQASRLQNQWRASQRQYAVMATTTEEERVVASNKQLVTAYKDALKTAAERMVIGEEASNLGSTAAVFLWWASKEMQDITDINSDQLQGLITKYLDHKHPVDNTGKPSEAREEMKSHLDDFLHWWIEGEVKPGQGMVIASNNQVETAYKTALQTAASGMLIGKETAKGLGYAAASFLNWAGIKRHDIAARNSKELQELITEYVDDQHPVDDTGKRTPARKQMESKLRAFLYSRKTDEEKRVVASNKRLVAKYKDALKTAADRMMIGETVPMAWSGAAAAFLEWASDIKKGYEIDAIKQHNELQGLITEYIDDRYPVDNTGKRSAAGAQMKGKLDAFLYWRKNETVKSRQGAESSTADDADGVWDPEAESLFAFFTDTGSGAADDADGEWDAEALESLLAFFTDTGSGAADRGAQGLLGDAESHVRRTAEDEILRELQDHINTDEEALQKVLNDIDINP
jgi:hypothetical protein